MAVAGRRSSVSYEFSYDPSGFSGEPSDLDLNDALIVHVPCLHHHRGGSVHGERIRNFHDSIELLVIPVNLEIQKGNGETRDIPCGNGPAVAINLNEYRIQCAQ